jgi:biotin-dependent carboxylase-like uncharacterized protein
MGSLEIVRPGLLTTIQDPGRYGLGHLGIVEAGWVDPWAAPWANRLLGNPDKAAVLEITGGGFLARLETPTILALTGADLGATVDGEPFLPGTARRFPAGAMLAIPGSLSGWRAYVAVPGGIDVPVVLGSRATDLVAGIGGLEGRALLPGDRVRWTGGGGDPTGAPVPTWLPGHRVRCLPGPEFDRLSGDLAGLFTHAVWRVSAKLNRTGLRLEGPPLKGSGVVPMVSRGMSLGSIQIPSGGEPVLLLQDRGTLGGYPVLATVIQADWPRMAQWRPGDYVAFRWVDDITAEQARVAQRQMRELPCQSEAPPPPVTASPVPAPWPGVITWGVEDGAWVGQGETVGWLDVGSIRERLRAPGDGHCIWLVRSGTAVAAGAWAAEVVDWGPTDQAGWAPSIL